MYVELQQTHPTLLLNHRCAERCRPCFSIQTADGDGQSAMQTEHLLDDLEDIDRGEKMRAMRAASVQLSPAGILLVALSLKI